MTVTRPETLVQHTVKTLQEQIAAGRFGDALPGEPRLASLLQVSRGTLRKALQIVADRGWISDSTTGKPRRIIGCFGARPLRRRAYRVGVLAVNALDDLPVGSQHFLRQLEEETESDKIVYSYHRSAATRQSRPDRWLRTLLAESPADLWLLYEATIPVARFFKSSDTPAIVCGGPALDEGLSYCGFDGAAALRHAIGLFVRKGHTRIILPGRYHRNIREQTVREEFAKRKMPFESSEHMPLWNNDLDQLRRILRRRLDSPDRATAYILTRLEALIVLYSCLMERRLAVPNDLSVLAIGSDPIFSCFKPAIGYYETPYRAIARAIAEMIRLHRDSPYAAPMTRILPTEYVRGGSVGPPPVGG